MRSAHYRHTVRVATLEQPQPQRDFSDSYLSHKEQIARTILIPQLTTREPLAGKRVLDVGCGGGGTVFPLVEADAHYTGTDVSEGALRHARDAAKREGVAAGFHHWDVCLPPPDSLRQEGRGFDIIVFRDTIEHIPDPLAGLRHLNSLLADDGIIYVSFPPFYSPFGGHQHLILPIPWLHLLPEGLFFGLLARFRKTKVREMRWAAEPLDDLRAVCDSRMSIGRFEGLVAESGLVVESRRFYLSRPVFRLRYGLPTLGAGVLGRVPGLREVLVTGAIYLLRRGPSAGDRDAQCADREAEE